MKVSRIITMKSGRVYTTDRDYPDIVDAREAAIYLDELLSCVEGFVQIGNLVLDPEDIECIRCEEIKTPR